MSPNFINENEWGCFNVRALGLNPLGNWEHTIGIIPFIQIISIKRITVQTKNNRHENMPVAIIAYQLKIIFSSPY